MRRLLVVVGVLVGAVALSGCSRRMFPSSMCWSDPFHPCTTNHPLCYGK